MTLYEQWMRAKAKEAEAVSERRAIEDQMAYEMNLDNSKEGSNTQHLDGFRVKITQRLNKKIDAEKLQDIAAHEGLSDQLGILFRWKPEINMKLWNSADKSITRPLSDAITVTPGRPSFSITKEEV